MILKFVCGAAGDLEEPVQLRITQSTATFGNVGRDGDTGATNLAHETQGLVLRKLICNPICSKNKIVGSFPNFQIAEIFRALSKCQLQG